MADSRSRTSWQSEESVLHNSGVMFSITLSVPQSYLYQLASICKKTMPSSLNLRIVLTMVRLGLIDQKSILMYQMSSVYQAASKSRGWSFLLDSEYSWVDWERVITHSFEREVLAGVRRNTYTSSSSGFSVKSSNHSSKSRNTPPCTGTT